MYLGRTIGKYRLEKHLGSGGMAEVYRAYQPSLDRYVAIKILHRFLANQEDFLTRFQQEARVVAMLRHPNIIQVYDFDYDQDDDVYYMVMEYIDGPTLKDLVEQLATQSSILPLTESVRIVSGVADALAYAHRHGMVHRDVKPANIMFDAEHQVILTDFGIAKIVNATGLTASGTLVGTPAYLAPEQGLGKAGDERADIYSLGVVLYQLTTGRLPYDAETFMGVVLKHINEPLIPPTEIDKDFSKDIEGIILRAMAKDPSQRYQGASEMAAQLRVAEQNLPHPSPEPIREARLPARPQSEPTVRGTPSASSGLTGVPSTPSKLRATPNLAAAPAAGGPTQITPTHGTKRSSRGGWLAWLGAGLMIVAVALGLWFLRLPDRLLLAVGILPGMQATQTSPASTAPPTVARPLAQTATNTSTSTPTAEPTVTPTPSATATASTTPDRTATWFASCDLDLDVVDDPPIRPAVLMPGQQFTKRWIIANTGSCRWPQAIGLIPVDDDRSRIIETPEIPLLEPGEHVEIKLTLRAPTQFASYTDSWQLQASDGQPIGDALIVIYRVAETPTPRPTATDTLTPTPEASPTPQEPLHFSVPVLVGWEDLPDNQWRGTVGLTAWGGTGQYRYYVNIVSPENEFHDGTFEFQAQRCRAWLGTVIVVSGPEEQRWQGVINYPGNGCP